MKINLNGVNMELDFRNCKTKEDVEKIFKEQDESFKIIEKINNELKEKNK